MESRIIYGIIFIAALYYIYRILTRPNKEFEKEIDDIINSDKYRIKGQYD